MLQRVWNSLSTELSASCCTHCINVVVRVRFDFRTELVGCLLFVAAIEAVLGFVFCWTLCMSVHSCCSANSSLGHHTLFCFLLVCHMCHERKGNLPLWELDLIGQGLDCCSFHSTSHCRPKKIKMITWRPFVSQSSFSKVRNHWVWFNLLWHFCLDRMSKHVRWLKHLEAFLQ